MNGMPEWMEDSLIVKGYCGSIAHGTYLEEPDDRDIFGIYVPPKKYVLGLSNKDHYISQQDNMDITYFSIRKFMRLLINQNPNVITWLWIKPEHIIKDSEYYSWDLRHNKEKFISKKLFRSFLGYANGQFHRVFHFGKTGKLGKVRKEQVQKYGYSPKNASHLIRLLRMLNEFLDTEIINVWRKDRTELLDIKLGKWSASKIERTANELIKTAKEKYINSNLRDNVDIDMVNDYLVYVQEDFWKQKAKPNDL